MSFEQRLKEQATIGLDVTERILQGQTDVPEALRKTALSLISGQLKQQAVNNGRITQIISLTKLGVRDADTRERIAKAALVGLLPSGTLASEEMMRESRPALAAEPAQ